MTRFNAIFRANAALAVLVMALAAPALTPRQSQQTAPGVQPGALARANLAKPRPKAPFDLTGTWLHDGRGDPNGWRFVPPTFKLMPEAQKHYDASQKAAKEG